MANKIKYDLKNAYYAIATIDETNAATYTTVHIQPVNEWAQKEAIDRIT